TAQRFNTDGTGAGVSVEHPRSDHPGTYDVEERLAQLVGRRAQSFPRRRLEAAALQGPSDDTHAIETKAPTRRTPRTNRGTRQDNLFPSNKAVALRLRP